MTRPLPPRVHEMHNFYERPGQTLASVAERFGISKNAVWMTFNRYRLPMRMGGNGKSNEPVPRRAVVKQWCSQCETRVSSADASRCRSQFCKAQEIAA